MKVIGMMIIWTILHQIQNFKVPNFFNSLRKNIFNILNEEQFNQTTSSSFNINDMPIVCDDKVVIPPSNILPHSSSDYLTYKPLHHHRKNPMYKFFLRNGYSTKLLYQIFNRKNVYLIHQRRELC